MSFQVTRYSEPKQPVGTVAELFAGVGGFRIGLAKAGLKTVFSNQWEPSTKAQHASDVYVARFGEEGHTNVDIASVKSLPVDVDLVVGGFPCQDYSVAKTLNTSKGLAGKKGVLWWEIHRLVSKHKPNYVFLENVDRLLKSPASQRGRDFAIMLKTLGLLGYGIEWRVVNAAEYGFPQRRIRVFIVAYKMKGRNTADLSHEKIFRGGILARALPLVEGDEKLLKVNLSDTVEMLSETFSNDAKVSPFQNSGFYLNGTAYTVKVKAKSPRSSYVLRDVLLDDAEVPAEFYVSSSQLKEWKYLKGAKAIERQHASGAIYRYAEGKMAFPDSLDRPSRTILTGEGGTSPSRFKHIVKSARGYRRLTPLELERLNGFPDNWTRFGSDENSISDVRRAFFMGNALVVGLVEKVGKVLAQEIVNSRQLK